MYEKLNFDETYRAKVRELITNGRYKIGDAGRLVPHGMSGALQTPWVFTNFAARRKYCTWWNHTYFGHFKVIPRVCRFNCWKTVIYPRNVYETFQLSDLLRALNLPSKCGADRRNYTYCAWAGFIYGDTLEEGKMYYEKIREGVDVHISPDIRVILKRGCTEMERDRPSDTWDDHTEQEKALEWQLDDLFEFSEENYVQSKWIINDIKEGWILRAIEIGDPTVERAIADFGRDGLTLDDLTVNSITYHDENGEK